MKRIYNFTTDNMTGGYPEIRQHLNTIYDRQENSFRVNLGFGMILFNNETRQYRYFIPRFNSRILRYPYTIITRNSIRLLLNKLIRQDIIAAAKTVRPSTAWSLAFITNVEYLVFPTNFVLGQGDHLPSYITNHHFIKSLHINNRTKEPYKDHMCFFRCLPEHRKRFPPVCENPPHPNPGIKEYLAQWRKFKNDYSDFKGVTVEDMHDLEKCFDIKILIYRLNEDQTVNLVFNSLNQSLFPLYLNICDNHLSYITKFANYAKRFQCEKCLKLFRREWTMKNHFRTCYDRTRYIFPGGFYNSPASIFEKMDTLGIVVPDNLRYYSNFIVWDMESILPGIHEESSDKLTWTNVHKPVSCSIASNIDHYSPPQCFIECDPQTLISYMMTYMLEISSYNKDTLLQLYSPYIEALDDLLSSYSDDSDSDSDSGLDDEINSSYAPSQHPTFTDLLLN